MEYLKLAKVYDKLESTPARLEKTDIITGFLNETPDDLLEIIPPLLMGRVFPLWSPSELGIGPGLLYDTISFVTGINKQDLKTTIGEMGDVGNAVETLFEKKVQTLLFSEKLTVEKVYASFENIADSSGKGAQGKKTKLLSNLLTNAAPIEAKYLVRTVLGELRVGVAEGVIRDAIANAYDIPQNVVERAYMLTNDFGKVAMTARARGEDGLKELTMEIGTPIKPMLAQISPSIKDAIKDCGTAAFEIKYDGARIQIHKNEDGGVKIFSRRLEDVTSALPDVVEMVDKAVKSNVIIEGEAVAVDPETRRPRAFQDILRRFRRKYDVSKMIEKIPFEIYVFDVLYADGKSTIDETFENRRKKLEGAVEPLEGKIELAEQIVTDGVQAGEKFYSRALEKGHEGVMVKNLKAPYVPGARVGYMYKIKPVMETLDLVITGALWGTGKRAGWLSSYILGAKDVETGRLVPVGRVGSGVTEEQLEEFTNTLKPLVEFNSGGRVKLKPELVVEVAFQEIQRSQKYESGFALRFPRVMKVREDKGPDDIDTISRIEELYDSQNR